MGMYGNINTPFKRGQTFYNGNVPSSTYWKETAMIEGMEGVFEDLAPATTRGQVLVKRSGRPVRCRVVRNQTAGETALLPKMVVTYKSGYRLSRVDAMVCVDDAECAGVVDEFLPSTGVAYGDLFWITVDGQTNINCGRESNVITAQDWLCGQTAATTNAATAGSVYTYVLTSDTTTAIPRLANRIGWAISAKTTGQTNADMLCNVTLR